jgi:hypothetical protein
MDGVTQFPKVGKLFAEDFDVPEVAPDPEAIEPVYSARELTAARDAAWRDGHEAGLQDAATSDNAATRQAIAAFAEQFAMECEAATARDEQSAEAIARLLLDSLAAIFPTLCVRYGDAEVRAIVRTVLPALTQEPAITVRANPRTARALTQEITRSRRRSPRAACSACCRACWANASRSATCRRSWRAFRRCVLAGRAPFRRLSRMSAHGWRDRSATATPGRVATSRW